MTPEELLQHAMKAREYAVATYSRFKVGAALLTAEGRVYTGCNIENATYGLTVCAERVALWKALSEGERSFARIAVASGGERPAAPCGACRQLLWEFCGDLEVVLGNAAGVKELHHLAELFPRPFDQRSL
jgi:cytidine deaminase